ncbi:adenosylmethionine--8-amino-7-oxononanoate transaminase [Aurantiacibacter gangjinensis]|uniref:Adenosylmethionine-8-amino-7-oxononanoate aminotransferase n=1 Tax=Aurantiacibacter gangjinensis TaxID=502682 RepID=A0A0G9MK98_9SPHN|nr:adenosylmethionine--8-amino-7-oxononanoate transaminase [Aurantiacibacter gangjinensis]APE29330.1 Adenosylmethionine-8-amino-7-oxononanoate aminotransferase [Aurantiacibacter gangjinensis]KLE31084.1 adenosylmethionine-8-amino-7-oxononanoate aminotransferase [Aurantiacibacter gangjinensis]
MSSSPVWHPFHQHGLGEPIPLVERAEGTTLYTADGRRVVDAISSWWVTTHGHNHPRIMKAIRAQTEKLDQLIFAGWTHEPAETLARGLVDMMPDGLGHVFFSDSGSTCVEVALKMALGTFYNRGEDKRSRILVMEHSYHGDTIGAMSIGARGVFNRAYAPLLFDVGTVPFPAAEPQPTYDALEAACAVGDVAAFIVEPLLLGAGGMLTYPPAVLAELHAICARHGVFFIADEVMTGWGRTGTLLACEQAGITPDILCLAKGLTGGSMPLAVTLASDEIYDAHYSTDRAKMFFHSSSYTANPIACAAACANLAIWREEDVPGRIVSLSAKLGSLLESLSTRDDVTNPRQCGTMIAFDVAVPDQGYLAEIGPRLRDHFYGQDVLLRPLGNTVYAMPPYCIEDADIARIADAMASGLDMLRA